MILKVSISASVLEVLSCQLQLCYFGNGSHMCVARSKNKRLETEQHNASLSLTCSMMYMPAWSAMNCLIWGSKVYAHRKRYSSHCAAMQRSRGDPEMSGQSHCHNTVLHFFSFAFWLSPSLSFHFP